MIILTSATPFLKTLLTTTTTPTHISDFRNLPRSDSRANKPDIFPGFDFIDEPTTVRPRTPVDFYSKIIGGIVNQGRQTYERIVNNLQNYEINRRVNLRQNSAQKLRNALVEQTVATTESMPTMFVDENLKPSKEQNWPKKYFSSILTANGFNKLRNASDPEYTSKIIGASATYINPLLNIWKRATMKLNFQRDTMLQQERYNQSSSSSVNDTNDDTTPHQQFDERITTSLVSSPSSSLLGFRYAFSKYLNLIAKGYGNGNENKTISEHSELSGVPWGDVNLNNNNTMGLDVDFPIERIDERKDDESIEDNNDDNDDDNESNENDAGNFGIFILEIFGTIAGLSWGAFSQLQNLFTQSGK